ncbi:MAG TPA: tetratricopeptide repeat protein [Terracidiphilus sp.]|nr:tetratricopeptide repeat protein [Terracidiphilus sp.]
MAFSDVKIHYYQSMFCIRSRSFLAFSAVITIACVLSLAGVAQVVSSQIQDQVQEHFLAAQQAQQQGRLDDAVGEYREVLRLQPQLPEAYANLGIVYYAQSKFSDSAQALSTAAKLRPGMRGVSLWRGIDEVRLNRPAQGVHLLREAVRLDPKEKLAQNWLGTALWDAGQMDAALIQLRKAATLFPDDPDLLFALGEAYGKGARQQSVQLLEDSAGTAISDRIYASTYAADHDWTKAEGHLRRAIHRDPHSVDAHLELADVLLEQAHLSLAREQLDQASALAPHSPGVLARSGLLLILVGQQADGLSAIEQAIQGDRSETLDGLGLPAEDGIGGKDAEVSLLPICRDAIARVEATPSMSPAKDIALAALYARLGNVDESARAYKRLPVDSQSARPAESSFAQAMRSMHQHRYEAAEATLLRWLAAHPRDLSARFQLIRSRRQIATAQIARLLAVAPDSYHVHQLLGQLYVDRDEDDKALAEYLAVAAARPDLPDVHFWLGHLYWKHGDADHALSELTRQLELDPGHPAANGELGAVLVSEDRIEEAIPHLELALRSKPDLWPAYQQLGQAYAAQKNYARAEEVLKHGLAHDHDGGMHYQLGQVLRDEGKKDEAARMFAQVRAIKNERSAATSSDDHADDGAKQ